MMKYCAIAIIILVFSCKRNFDAPVPDTRWELFESAGAVKLDETTRPKLEGIYTLTGTTEFGSAAAAKWSYTVTGADTVYHLSFFCESLVSYFIMEGRNVDSTILLNGYWRKMQSTETGKARFTITKENGGAQLLKPGPVTVPIIITGNYGRGEGAPDQAIIFMYKRPIYRNTTTEIVAHRGGGSTSDFLPASENSIGMLRLASRFGATGVEIDVRLTRDKVPVIYHDATLNERLIQKDGLLGPIVNFTYAQLNTLVRLKDGQRIPTLREALETILYQTPLRFVWLDTKFEGSMEFLKEIQAEYIQKAAAAGRTLQIYIGIPDEAVVNNFLKLPGYQNIPSVCELTPEDVEKTNAHIWAPRWTLGLQNEEVARMHASGRRVFVWTLDVPENVQQFLNEGNFDGILSNYPSIVAYYYYAKQ